MRLKRKVFIFLLSSFVFLLISFSANALEITYPQVPGADKTPQQCTELESGEQLGCYVNYVYYFLLSISGLVCFFSIISGGVLYLIAGGSVEKLKEGRERIGMGFLGAVIILSSYLILNILNPQLLVLGPKKPEIEEPIMPEIPEYEGEKPVYVEIPYGRLIERVKIISDIANYWSYQIWYEGAENNANEHTSLNELTNCLKQLTDECNCEDITTNCSSPPGQCIGDPCDKTRTTNCQHVNNLPAKLKESIEDVNQRIPQQNDVLLEVKIMAQVAQESLDYANSRLKIAEALIRDSITPALNYDSFIALENKIIRNLWAYEDVPIEQKQEPSNLPIPPQECSSDAPHEIVPSCTICGNVLFCYGNAFRLCETDSLIPAPTQANANPWFDASVFPSGYVLYNGVILPVPSGGVYTCDSNVYGCANALCSSQSLSEPKDDPATFYISVQGNQDILSDVENLLIAPPPMIPPSGPVPPVDGDEYPPVPPDAPISHDLQDIAMWVQQKTGVRAALILALLYHESGLVQFPGTGRYPGAFCCNRSNWWKINNCNNFDKIWNEVGHLYPQYTKYTMPVSSAGYIGGVYNCGGAMGPAQAMPFAWVSYKAEIKLITGKSAVSPWDFQDAFTLTALHLRDRGGADSQKCVDEKIAICNYWGDRNCRNYNSYATAVLQRANGIVQQKTAAGKSGWTKCNGGAPGPGPTPGGEWQWPIRGNTVLSNNAQMHLNHDSVCAWDFTAECGRPIYPIKAGWITYAGCNNSGWYGCWISITHGAGWKSYYAHMRKESINVSYGQYVTTDTILGKVGCTGWTEFGPHVHLEIFGPRSTPGCKGRVDPKEVLRSPLFKAYCYGAGCPTGKCNPAISSCPCTGDPRGICW